MHFFCVQRDAEHSMLMLHASLISHFFTVRKSLLGSPSRKRDSYSILRHLAFSEATDPRDLLYSNIGLLISKYNSSVDYSDSNTMSLVLTQFAQRIIEVDKDMRILRYACTLNTEDDRTERPSWVPNWKRAIDYTSWAAPKSVKLLDGIQPIYWPEFRCQFYTDHKISGTTIVRIPGRLIATVESLGGDRTSFRFKLNVHTTVEFRARRLVPGDELWLLNNAAQVHLLRKRKAGGHVLVHEDPEEEVRPMAADDGLTYAE